MPDYAPTRDAIRKLLEGRGLSFRDFLEIALYHRDLGYYAQAQSPIGREGDYVTSHEISPVFGYSLGRLVGEFLSRTGDGVCSIVDIGCGDGSLINTLYVDSPRARFSGVDRNLGRLPHVASRRARFANDLAEIEALDCQLVISNELFDALPFARLVKRGERLHELWVTTREGDLDWTEREADPAYEAYFADRGIALEDGQFADVSLDWERLYERICRFVSRGLIVTFDYGLAESKLFRGRMRRFGTAAAYAHHRVSRDLLANPGEQDVTAHINFSDLQRAGERSGYATLFFDVQAKFLLSLGAHEHELLQPNERIDSLEVREKREDAKRLILPDGIGYEIKVLVQGRGVPLEGWSFQRKLF